MVRYIKVACDHIDNGGIIITSSEQVQVEDAEFSIEDLVPNILLTKNVEVFEPLWAVRPAHGKMYGRKYIQDYKPFLKGLFELGEQDESQKLGPSRMLQKIQDDPVFGLRLDHPSETEIRTYVSSLIQTAKRNKRKRDINPDDTQGTTQGSSASRARLDLSSEELDFITNTCKETPNMRPSEFYTLFIAKYPSTALSVAQIKTKFSNVKASLKN